ncbi:glycosyltransferase family 39 protein [Hymenobacter tibetensis]|uniref:Glycosyltransferase family 39 protein n=1 Tax=Hymenobacter tibetensis TaxID=497967 RepID=A0ABY4D0J3_9BACT|nr:glycosyltransferase family 39 protein [Hymenobacter tibetensis]UOG74744.1 glycosyltransferase family 39 protein [Hymenobacter tibetensis]
MSVSTTARKVSVGAFFSLLLVLGLCLHRDYGVSWDETTDHQNGAVNGRYVAELLFPGLLRGNPKLAAIPPLANYHENDHGVLFELPVAALGFLLTPSDSQTYFYMRHLLIFLMFVGGVWVLYQLGTIYFQSWQWGLLAALLLVLSPRFFAEAFFNGKDIPFMVCFALAMYTLFRFIAQPTAWRMVAHAVATAAAIDIRVPGIMLIAFTIGMILLEIGWAVPGRTASPRRWLFLALLYLGLTAILVVAGWPALWTNPVAHFMQAYQSLSHFNWPAKTNFYLGHYVAVEKLPWHYIPVWLVSTTPLPYVLVALLGLAAGLYQACRKGWGSLRSATVRLELLLAGWLFAPVIIVVALGSVLYDGWRHLYFIYPALLLWAVRGVKVLAEAVWQKQSTWKLSALGVGVFGLNALYVGGQMIQLHPYQNLYFSVLPPATAEQLMERDYWGLGFREGLEWIAVHDTSSHITIHTPAQYPLYNNLLILNPADRARFHYFPSPKSRYFITNFRWQPDSYLSSLGPEVYVIRAGGIKILSVFRRP